MIYCFNIYIQDLLKVLLLGEADLEVFIQENPLDTINTEQTRGSVQSAIKILEKATAGTDKKKVTLIVY